MGLKDVKLTREEVTEVGTVTQNLQSIKDFLTQNRQDLDIAKTTTTTDGLTIDWIPIQSQGEIADPPPIPPAHAEAQFGAQIAHHRFATPVLAENGAEIGPEGTVPVFRHGDAHIDGTTTLDQYLRKELPPDPLGNKNMASDYSTADPFTHHWAGSYQDVKHYGCNGCYSCFDPYVQARDSESLIQTGMINIRPEREMQAVEVGWQVLPQLYGDNLPHLFTYYRTNGPAVGNYVGGYNRVVKGWVQVDPEIMPGSTFSPLNVRGDADRQYQINIATHLYNGNWWVWVQGRWIGYYPANLFSDAVPGANDTLASYGTRLGFWGEIADSSTITTATRTDMGSGHFPEKGFGWSAYMNRLSYLDTPNGRHAVWYDGSNMVYAADPKWYRIDPHFRPAGGVWGSYAYVGGPGAGWRLRLMSKLNKVFQFRKQALGP